MMASSPKSSSSSDNKAEQDSNASPSSLESFLFLPQLPVFGDDDESRSAHLSSQLYHHRHHNDNQNQQLLFPRLFSSFKPSSIMGHTNHNHQSNSNHHHPRNGSNSSSVPVVDHCGKLSAIDTVIAPHSESLSGVKSHFSSSMSVLIRNAESCNSSGGLNHSPFSLAANHHPKLRRFLLFRICQAVCILLCLLFLLNLVKSFVWTSSTSSNDDEYNLRGVSSLPSASHLSHFKQQNRLIQSWNMPSIHPSSSSSSVFKFPEIISASVSTSNTNGDDEDGDDSNAHNLLLLDIPNFSFLLDNKTKCLISSESSQSRDFPRNYNGVGDDQDQNTIFFMIIVHSAPQNLMERQAIRETWGSLQRLGEFHVRLVFLLGHDTSDEISGGNNNNFHHHDSSSFAKILRESQKYGDIVTGNFHDSYRNLTVKHLMGYKWILSHCSDSAVKFVLKCDDDVFMDIFQLYDFLLRTFGSEPDASLICNVFPEGTKPVRGTDTQGKKWEVTYEEYPYDSYPKYCGGLAYLATPNVIREIYRTSRNMHDRYLWIDDVYVTGILRELAHVEPFYLNLRYSYDPEEYRKWLAIPLNSSLEKGGSEKDDGGDNPKTSENYYARMTNGKKEKRPSPPLEKIPFMIVHLERGPSLLGEMQMLWNKTKIVWSESGIIL